jgi:hypothetical protein
MIAANLSFASAEVFLSAITKVFQLNIFNLRSLSRNVKRVVIITKIMQAFNKNFIFLKGLEALNFRSIL